MKFKLPLTIISGAALLLAQQQIAIPETAVERTIASLNPTSTPTSPPPVPQQNLISYANPNISLQRTLTGHSKGVVSVAISPDGRTLVSGSDDRTIKVWDLATGRVKATTRHSGAVRSVAISPDGRTIVSGSTNETIKVWDLATGRLKATLIGHSGEVFSVAISPEGKTLVSSSVDQTIKVWDLTTGRIKATLTGHSDEVDSVAISPDGRTIVSGSSDDIIKNNLASSGNGSQRNFCHVLLLYRYSSPLTIHRC